LTSEEVTALRRQERKQFKKDRAQAMLNASLAAEAILTGKAIPTTLDTPGEEDTEEGLRRINSSTPSTSSTNVPAGKTGPRANVLTTVNETFIPTVNEYAHVLPEGETRLTPQTFLVRPTRPGQRVGMKKAPTPSVASNGLVGTTEIAASELRVVQNPEPIEEEKIEEPLPPIKVQDFEHLQLNLEEAFFLSWAVGCLKVVHQRTVSFTNSMPIC
jgi:tRNA-splicing endonuclease subunit Sen2